MCKGSSTQPVIRSITCRCNNQVTIAMHAMDFNESSPLLSTVSQTFQQNRHYNKGLSIFFAVICVVDIFGVFPIVTLPKAIIQCGKK